MLEERGGGEGEVNGLAVVVVGDVKGITSLLSSSHNSHVLPLFVITLLSSSFLLHIAHYMYTLLHSRHTCTIYPLSLHDHTSTHQCTPFYHLCTSFVYIYNLISHHSHNLYTLRIVYSIMCSPLSTSIHKCN